MTHPLSTTPHSRVYLAGPEVFFPNPSDLGAHKCAICAQYGFEGVFPLDAELDLGGLSPHAKGYAISEANEQLMRSCDLVIANMTPFRGPSMDVGTAFEMGFMRALDKPVFGYSNIVGDYKQRADEYEKMVGGRQSPSAAAIKEDFQLLDNLMMPGAAHASGGKIISGKVEPDLLYLDLRHFEAAVQAAQKTVGFRKGPGTNG